MSVCVDRRGWHRGGDGVYPVPRSLPSSERMEIDVYICVCVCVCEWVYWRKHAAELIREHCVCVCVCAVYWTEEAHTGSSLYIVTDRQFILGVVCLHPVQHPYELHPSRDHRAPRDLCAMPTSSANAGSCVSFMSKRFWRSRVVACCASDSCQRPECASFSVLFA